MSTTTLSPEYLAANKQNSLWAPQIVPFVLATIAIALRITSRKIIAMNFGWDDYFIFIAYMWAAGTFAVFLILVDAGVGKHIEVVAATRPHKLIIMLQALTPGEMFYTLSICFSKLSILAMYWRIFSVSKVMRKVMIVVGCIVVGWTISVVVTSGVACVPLAKLWNTTLPGHCISLTKFYLIISYPNVFTDWALLIMPLPHVWKLNMPTRQKVIVSGLLCMGSFVCVVSTIRLVIMSRVDLVDFTWGLINVTIWTSIEAYCTIICICLPSLKPLVALVFNLQTATDMSEPTTQPTGNAQRSGAWSKKKKSKRSNFETITGANDNDDASVSRLRGDTYWAQTTTAYATNEGVSAEDIQLQDVEKGKNTINVKSTIHIREDHDWEAKSH